MKERIVSIDIFRGMTIFLMVLVNTPGTWSAVYAPFRHAKWHGYTPTDLVFPFFLFVVGCSIVFAYSNKNQGIAVYKKISTRTLKLIALGIFLGAFTLHFPFFKPFAEIRFPGVLQRIGVVFFCAALLFLNMDWKRLVGSLVALLVGYWLLMTLVPVNGVAPTLERAPNNLANYVDVVVFGTHNYKPDYDPEGLLSTMPAVATCLLGVFSALIIRSRQPKKATILFGLGGSYLILGHLWDLAFPINKALWTSSFVLVTAGWANVLLALIYYLTDAKKVAFGRIFKYMGANALAIYFLSSFINKMFYMIKVDGETSLHGWLFKTFYVHDFWAMETASLLYSLTVVGFYCLLAYILWKRRVFIKV